MTQNKLRPTVIAAAIFGLVAAYGIFGFLRQQRQAQEAFNQAHQAIVIAAKDIEPGNKVTRDMVKLTPWPKVALPPGYLTSYNDVVDKALRVAASAGDPITAAKVDKDGIGLTVLLRPGYRAMAVKVDEIIGVSGFLAPDDHVDVIATFDPPGNQRNDKVSKIVLQDKRVLSVAQNMPPKGGKEKDPKPQLARSITLELTPSDSEKLSLAALEGKIILALRPRADQIMVQTHGTTKGDLLNIASAPKPKPPVKAAVAAAAPAKYQVEIFLGGKKTVQEF